MSLPGPARRAWDLTETSTAPFPGRTLPEHASARGVSGTHGARGTSIPAARPLTGAGRNRPTRLPVPMPRLTGKDTNRQGLREDAPTRHPRSRRGAPATGGNPSDNVAGLEDASRKMRCRPYVKLKCGPISRSPLLMPVNGYSL
jgi:hypothetical protein